MAGPLAAATDAPLFFPEEDNHIIGINNRILAKVNGQVISVVDVMKKMDMLFYRQFPQYTSSTEARFQFYQLNWKKVLQELVDKHWIMSDAESTKMTVSNGDVRQEMENLFGPNIIVNLDKVGLTFDEAWQMVHDDILIRRMIFHRVTSKAIKKISPKDVREAYIVFSKDNIRPGEWHYTVISIRSEDPAQAEEVSKLAHTLLTEGSVPLTELNARLTEKDSLGKEVKLNVSEDFNLTDKEISPAYKDILAQLENGTYSAPVAQKSRDKSIVYRIFYLKDKTETGPIPFTEVENQLKDHLIDEAIAKETKAYLDKLKYQFNTEDSHHTETEPENFQPFILK